MVSYFALHDLHMGKKKIRIMKKPILILLSCFFLIVSCETAPQIDESYSSLNQKANVNKKENTDSFSDSYRSQQQLQTEEQQLVENLRTQFLQNDSPSACLPTDLAPLVTKYMDQLMSDPVAGGMYDNYIRLNRTLALNDTDKQYFGKDGEYTRLMEKRIRELERFWGMRGEISVKGQHSETLDNRDKLAGYFYSISFDDRSWENAYDMAEQYIENNRKSDFLPESPLLAGDGFTNHKDQIVIGDGLVQILSETGIAPEIIWTGILAHEWIHQIQINHTDTWYNGESPFLNAPVIKTELEADFFAAYFLTHKRGATYNWKRVEEFMNLFFQSGDCALDNPQHHGTPDQRMTASELGYELAESAQKKGHILSPDEVHEAFESLLPQILDGSLQ